MARRFFFVLAGAAIVACGFVGCFDWTVGVVGGAGEGGLDAGADARESDGGALDAGDASDARDAADANARVTCPETGEGTVTCELDAQLCCSTTPSVYACATADSCPAFAISLACTRPADCPGQHCCWRNNGPAASGGKSTCETACATSKTACVVKEDCPDAGATCELEPAGGQGERSPLTVCR